MPLFLVATPIGNLKDLSDRAREVLAGADVVLAEDTRQTRKLLQHAGLDRPMLRYDEHVHRRSAPEILDRLARGEKIALATDAGTPGLSDPGGRLVAEAVARNLPVIPIPGPSALLAALAASGLPWDRFTFLGFLPRRPGRLKRELEAGRERTIVFYESPHRVVKTLDIAREVLGDAPCAVARELTKIHEEILRGPLSTVAEALRARSEVRGEITVVVAPAETPADDSNEEDSE